MGFRNIIPCPFFWVVWNIIIFYSSPSWSALHLPLIVIPLTSHPHIELNRPKKNNNTTMETLLKLSIQFTKCVSCSFPDHQPRAKRTHSRLTRSSSSSLHQIGCSRMKWMGYKNYAVKLFYGPFSSIGSWSLFASLDRDGRWCSLVFQVPPSLHHAHSPFQCNVCFATALACRLTWLWVSEIDEATIYDPPLLNIIITSTRAGTPLLVKTHNSDRSF